MKLNCYKKAYKLSHWAIMCDAGKTIYKGWDVGLGGGVGGALSTTHQLGTPYDSTQYGGDLNQIFYAPGVSGGFGVTTNDQRNILPKYSKLYLTLRNNHNFGCFLKVYYTRHPRGQAINANTFYTADQGLETIIPNSTTTGSSDIGSALDLTETSLELPHTFSILRRRIYKFMPGETISLRLRAPIGRKIHNLDVMSNKWRGLYTRSIILQATGFPLKGTFSTGDVSSAQVDISVIVQRKICGYMDDAYYQNGLHLATAQANTDSTFKGQQWQTGTEDTET